MMENLKRIVADIRGKKIFTDKGLAKLGDGLINASFSAAESAVTGIPVGLKVDKEVLASAFNNCGLRSYLGSRMNTHAIADAAEALIAYAYCKGLFDFEEMVSLIIDGLLSLPIDNIKKASKTALLAHRISGVENLLREISARLGLQ